MTDLIYAVCPDSRPLFDPKAPRCGFEAWFGQPEAAASTQRFRMYPRVAEVQEEVAARSESLARRSKPLSRVIPARALTYALADDAGFASSQPVNSAFAQLADSRALGSRRWGSLTFSDMERLERLFQGQLEVTSSSLWLMSGILAMFKRDRFQPSDPALCSDRILTCRIKSICSPAKVGLVVTDLITSPVVSLVGGRHPPSTAAQLSFFA